MNPQRHCLSYSHLFLIRYLKMYYLVFMSFIASLLWPISAASLPSKTQTHKSGGTFNLTNFYVSSSPHSTITRYEFGVTDGRTSAQCNGNIATGPYISSLGNTCCDKTDCRWMFSFQLSSKSSGYVLNVTNISRQKSHNSTDIAVKFYPLSAVKVCSSSLY